MKRITFNEQVTVLHPIIQGELAIVTKQPITSEEQLANRKSPFQEKRIKMKARMYLRHLQRKALRPQKKKREEERKLDDGLLQRPGRQ